MAILFIQDVDGGNRWLYDQISAAVGYHDEPPEGLICHTAGPVDGGWHNVDVWESVAALERFRDDRLDAVVRRLGGLPSEPRIQITEIYDLFIPA